MTLQRQVKDRQHSEWQVFRICYRARVIQSHWLPGRFKLYYTLDFPPSNWNQKKGFITAEMWAWQLEWGLPWISWSRTWGRCRHETGLGHPEVPDFSGEKIWFGEAMNGKNCGLVFYRSFFYQDGTEDMPLFVHSLTWGLLCSILWCYRVMFLSRCKGCTQFPDPIWSSEFNDTDVST